MDTVSIPGDGNSTRAPSIVGRGSVQLGRFVGVCSRTDPFAAVKDISVVWPVPRIFVT